MSLSATTQGFLKEVESSTGFKVLVEEQGSGLQVPLLAKVQVARRGMPFHRVVYHPSAGGMADYLVCYHCAFILRLHSLPAAERFNLADNPVAEEECLKWTRAHEGSDPSDAERQTEVAGFLRTALMTMVRSVPVGIWVDQDLRARFPDLRAAQEQAIRRQVDTQAQVVSPRVREDVPAPALRANCAINAAFAKVWPVPQPGRPYRSSRTGSPSGPGQLRHPQDREGGRVVPKEAPLPPALHADQRLLAQPGGTVVREDHRAAGPPRGVQKRGRIDRRDRRLLRGQQQGPEVIRMDRDRRAHS